MSINLPISPTEAWNRAIEHTLKMEGGLVNHPADPGGITNYGISLRFLQAEGLDIDGDGDVDAQDIRGLTLEQAKGVYYKCFWKRYAYDQYPAALAIKLFDMTVNMGPVQSHKILQRALWGYGQRVEVDGQIGQQTKTAIAQLDWSPRQPPLVPVIRVVQHQFYLSLIQKNPKLAAFERGWVNRAYS